MINKTGHKIRVNPRAVIYRALGGFGKDYRKNGEVRRATSAVVTALTDFMEKHSAEIYLEVEDRELVFGIKSQKIVLPSK